ncbi:glycosyltransferase family 2 protein [Dactylosporangium sp. CA-092794]|uniref:glycosyltransferase family 2 protein n=1 Tax=Dactylosporangium sp. CA-092794 TaxID=3239929 RepID=UPI003D8F14AB
MRPEVSVIVPAYNSATTLGACLAAIRAQREPVAEVIVVDDASTDGTREIARRFGCRLVESPVNRGPAAARNLGIRASRGEILFFVDSDCAPLPDALGVALRIMRDEPDVVCVHGIYALEPMFDDGPIEAYRLLHGHYWRRRHAGRVRTTLFALCAIRRAVFDEVGGFDERLRASEDVEFGDRLGAHHGIVLSAEMAGRHDDDSRLGALLRKQFGRSQLLIPVALAERGPAGIRANSPAAVALAALAAVTLPLGLVAPALLAVPALALAGFVLADPGLLRFVAARRGPAFAGFFFAVHFLVQLAIVAGALAGGLRHLRDRDFGPARVVEEHLSR